MKERGFEMLSSVATVTGQQEDTLDFLTENGNKKGRRLRHHQGHLPGSLCGNISHHSMISLPPCHI